MAEGYQVCLTTLSCSKDMLTICQDLVVIQMFHGAADNVVFFQFAVQACNRDWSITADIESITLFEDGLLSINLRALLHQPRSFEKIL